MKGGELQETLSRWNQYWSLNLYFQARHFSPKPCKLVKYEGPQLGLQKEDS